MRYAITGFMGERPVLHDRALPENYAAIAQNAKFDSAILEPINLPSQVSELLEDAATIFLFDGQWLSWPTIVDAVRAPVATSRLYYTGDGAPKVRQGATVYPLALLPPEAAPSVTNLSTPDPELIETCVFAYTHVTELGEESQPSAISAEIDTSAGVVVRIDGFAAVPSGRGIVARRIYRSVTSAAGVTGLYFAAEIDTSATFYDHDIVAVPLAEAMPSTDYDPPPDDMLGLTSMPNGMMAAFSGKDVYFCEPYRPHAWPEKYVMTVDYPVVGLCAFGSYLAILTSGTPYVMQGTHPESMASEKLETTAPCLSRRGIVDIGMAAYFPSTDGLIQIGPDGMQNITAGVFTRNQWLGFSPETISAERIGSNYLFLRTVSAFDIYAGGDAAGWDGTPDDLIGGSVAPSGEVPDIVGGSAGSAFGEQSLGVIERRSATDAHFIRLDASAPLAMHNDALSGDLYLLGSDARTVSRWDDRSAAAATAKWRSKRLTTPFPVSFSAVMVKTARTPVSGDTFIVRVYANGVVADTITTANRPCRIRAALAEEWEIEIETNVGVVAATIGQSVDEVMGFAA